MNPIFMMRPFPVARRRMPPSVIDQPLIGAV
jgi:hypothetical protein